MFIFGVLVTWKRDFWASTTFLNKRIEKNNFGVWKSMIVMWYVKSAMYLFPMVIRTYAQPYKCAYSKFKGIVSSVLFCWVTHYVHFQQIVDLKTRFQYIEHFAQTNNIGKDYGVWIFIIVLWYVKTAMPQGDKNKRANVSNPNSIVWWDKINDVQKSRFQVTKREKMNTMKHKRTK